MTQDYRCWLCFTMWSQYRQGQWHKTTDALSLSVLWSHCEAEPTSVVLCHCPCLYCTVITLWSRANICSLVSLSLSVLWSHCEAELTSVVLCSTDKDNDTRLQMLALLHNVITVQTRTMTQDYRCWLCFTMWSQYSTDKDNESCVIVLVCTVITLWSRANICSLVSLSLSVLWSHFCKSTNPLSTFSDI
jgi:hypothetical protein